MAAGAIAETGVAVVGAVVEVSAAAADDRAAEAPADHGNDSPEANSND